MTLCVVFSSTELDSLKGLQKSTKCIGLFTSKYIKISKPQ